MRSYCSLDSSHSFARRTLYEQLCVSCARAIALRFHTFRRDAEMDTERQEEEHENTLELKRSLCLCACACVPIQAAYLWHRNPNEEREVRKSNYCL